MASFSVQWSDGVIERGTGVISGAGDHVVPGDRYSSATFSINAKVLGGPTCEGTVASSVFLTPG